MTRIPRHRLGKGVFHVYNRAVDRKWIFNDEQDKQQFLSLLVRFVRPYPITIYHWVIMSNHFHIAADAIVIDDLSKWLSKVSRGYTMAYHKRKGGSGRLWQDRFKSVVVQKEGYLERLGRYIERNPIKAKMKGIDGPWSYRWSSAQVYVSGNADELVDPSNHRVWMSMGDDIGDRCNTYKVYLQSERERHEDESLFREFGVVIGDKDFCRNAYMKQGRITSRRPGRPRKNGVTN